MPRPVRDYSREWVLARPRDSLHPLRQLLFERGISLEEGAKVIDLATKGKPGHPGVGEQLHGCSVRTIKNIVYGQTWPQSQEWRERAMYALGFSREEILTARRDRHAVLFPPLPRWTAEQVEAIFDRAGISTGTN